MTLPSLPFIFVVLGTLIQGVVVILSRKYGIAFLVLIPLIIVHQYLFLTAYTKTENFTIIWFFAAGLTGTVALIIGTLVFQDAITWKSGLGIFLILCGIVLTKI